jgi:hypothetical protein
MVSSRYLIRFSDENSTGCSYRQCFLLPKSCRKLYTEFPAIRRQQRKKWRHDVFRYDRLERLSGFPASMFVPHWVSIMQQWGPCTHDDSKDVSLCAILRQELTENNLRNWRVRYVRCQRRVADKTCRFLINLRLRRTTGCKYCLVLVLFFYQVMLVDGQYLFSPEEYTGTAMKSTFLTHYMPLYCSWAFWVPTAKRLHYFLRLVYVQILVPKAY